MSIEIVKKPSLEEETRAAIAEVEAKASDSDRKKVADLISEAEGSAWRSGSIVAFTSGMAAIIFIRHNKHNREWEPRWSQELTRRMKTGQWKRNNETIGFYDDGVLEDGGHRLGALAVSNMSIEWPVVFGVKKDAIDTVDAGRRRTGADHAGLEGIQNASTKQSVVKNVANYLVKAGDPSAALRSEVEVKQSIVDNNRQLEEAIDIGEQSLKNINSPSINNKKTAAALAYLLIKNGWASQRVREMLALFQQTTSGMTGEDEPFYQANKLLTSMRERKARGEVFTTLKEMAVGVFTMVETEKGAKAITSKTIKAAVKDKQLPNPRYPVTTTAQAA